MPEINPQQLTFGGGLNAVAPPHLVAEDEVQLATNIDFSLERGAASVRRGSKLLYSVGSGTITKIYRHYNSPHNIGASPWYVQCGTNVYRGVSGTFVAITSGNLMGAVGYKDHCFVAVPYGTNCVKDDGTTVTQWVKQAPATAPSVTVSTIAPLVVSTSYTIAEGTGTITSGTATATCAGDSFRAQFTGTPISTNLNLNGSDTIGDYGVDYLEIMFSNPSMVTRVSRDYSIGDGSFTNYWHTEMDVQLSDDALPDVQDLIELDEDADFDTTQQMISEARQVNRAPQTRVSAAKDVFNVWAVPRTKFEFVGNASTPGGWGNIGACRVVIEAREPVVVTIKNWQIQGATTYPLNDVDVGYCWWETFVTLDTANNVISESAPSPASARTKLQQARAIVVGAASPTGSHGLTHRVLYRQGGYLQDAYAVATNSLAVATFTDSLTDIAALSAQQRLNRNLLPRDWFPYNILHVETMYDRVFVGYLNKIAWSLPGQPDSFPKTSQATVSFGGDEVQGLVCWPPGLVIVNRDSVYELSGNIFEGNNADWLLTRTGSRHGSKSRWVTIKTPYGIPLLDADGLYLYVPGQGVDQPIPWAVEKMADVFRGGDGNDPAALKGSRVPTVCMGYLNNSVAAFADDKLYLGLPVNLGGGNYQYPNALFVLDFRAQQVYGPWTYPFSFTSMFWDHAASSLVVGTTDGKLMQLEYKLWDEDSAGAKTPITFHMRTRAWTTPNDVVLENLAVEYAGGTGVAKGIYDGTTTVTLGTFTNATKDWLHPALSGSVCNNAVFDFSGTQGTSARATLYGVQFDALAEPKRVTYWKTEYEVPNAEGEALWDVHHADLEIIGTGTVTATVFVNGTAVMTRTDLVGPTAGRVPQPCAYPADTTGKIGHTVYKAGSGVVFKHWSTVYNTRPEPPRVDSVVWGPFSYPSKQHFRTWVAELNPNGTCSGALYADGTLIAVETFVGTRHTTFNAGIHFVMGTFTALTTAIDVQVAYAGTGLKHYDTKLETEPLPFHKTSWTITYKKIGGASQLDLARFWSYDIEAATAGTATLTSVWDIDGTAFSTNTIVATGGQWRDRIAFPPGARGYDFQQRLKSSIPIHVNSVSLDTVRVGIKGLARASVKGAPVD